MMSFKNVTFRNLNDIFDINDSEHVAPDLDIAYESVIDGDSTPAKEHLANLFYNELRCVDEYKGPKVLFRFAGLTEIEEICKETNTANEKREMAEKDYVSLSGFKIRAVYMGYRIDNLYESILKKLCNTKNIPLYKMEFDMNDITKLKAKSIYI